MCTGGGFPLQVWLQVTAPPRAQGRSVLAALPWAGSPNPGVAVEALQEFELQAHLGRLLCLTAQTRSGRSSVRVWA